MALSVGIRRVNIRWDPLMGEEGTFLLRCDDCATSGKSSAYYPLTLEYWLPSQGLQRCRACHRDRHRRNHRQSPEQRRAAQRRRYYAIRDTVLAYRREYYAANRERIRGQRRQAYARRKAARQLGEP